MLQCLQSARLPSARLPTSIWYLFFLPASGLHKEHKKVEDYFPTVSQKAKQKDHQAFLSSRKNWTKQHNKAGPDKKRLLSKKELVEAHKGLQIQHTTGGRFLAPKKQLVTAENWIEAKHGKWTQPRWLQKRFLETPCKACGLQRARNVWFWWIWRYRYPGARESAW